MPAGIAPPPNVSPLPIGAEDQIGMPVAVDIGDRPARLDREIILVDHIAIPTGGRAAIPNQGRRLLPERKHKIVPPIAI